MLAGTNAFAASHYIRAGASGANTGADWTNAWTSFSQVTWTRGDLYYIAAGSYGGLTLSTPASGTSTIEIRAAIGGSGDHGTSTGWSDSFQGQALLTGSTITTNYWTLNAQAVPGCRIPRIILPAISSRSTILDRRAGTAAREQFRRHQHDHRIHRGAGFERPRQQFATRESNALRGRARTPTSAIRGFTTSAATT